MSAHPVILTPRAPRVLIVVNPGPRVAEGTIQAIALSVLQAHSGELGGIYHHERQKRDDVIFGPDKLIYCAQHLRPHATGWCTVSVEDKIDLGIHKDEKRALERAADKCRKLGLRLVDEGEPKDWIAKFGR